MPELPNLTAVWNSDRTRVFLVDDTRQPLAEVYGAFSGDPEAERLADVLAAAPDLKEAMVEIDQLLDLRDVAEGADKRLLLEFDDAGPFREACRKALEALARAEGR